MQFYTYVTDKVINCNVLTYIYIISYTYIVNYVSYILYTIPFLNITMVLII